MKPFADLTRFINPRGIAVVGASPRESSQGRRLYENLALHSTAPGEVYPVNPAYEEIGGRRCWPSISDLPAGDIDVALVMVNAARVLDTLKQCVRRGIPYAVVMTSGFSEAGEKAAPGTRDRRAVPRHRPARLRTELPRLRERARPHRHDLLARLQDDLNNGGIGLATQGGGWAATCCKACPMATAWGCGSPPATRSTWRFPISSPTWRPIPGSA